MKKMVLMAAVAMAFAFASCGNKQQAAPAEAPAEEEITAQAAGETPACCAEAQADSTKTCCCGGAQAEEAPAEGAACCQGEKK